MKYKNSIERKLYGVCVKCEGEPVATAFMCQKCYDEYRVVYRNKMRKSGPHVGRQLWSPVKNQYISVDDLVEYDDLRAQIAVEMDTSNATGTSICEKYKISWTRLRKICTEHGVILRHKQKE